MKTGNECAKYAMMIAELLRYEKANDYFNMTTLCRNDFQKTVYDAIEKQIPKKPNMYVGEYDYERYPLCPACGGELMPNGEKYCSDCGQKISWED